MASVVITTKWSAPEPRQAALLCQLGLRRSYASAAPEAGVDTKIVSGRLGHASVAITSDLCQHPRAEAAQAAALILGGGA